MQRLKYLFDIKEDFVFSATPLDLCGMTSSDFDFSSILLRMAKTLANFSLHEVSTEDRKKSVLFGIFFSAFYLHRGMYTGISDSNHRVCSDLCHLALLCFTTLNKKTMVTQWGCKHRSNNISVGTDPRINTADLFLWYFHICNLAIPKYLLNASFCLQDFMFRMWIKPSCSWIPCWKAVSHWNSCFTCCCFFSG